MKRLLEILDSLIFIFSPIAILFFLLGALMLPIELMEHPNYLKALETEGVLTEAWVDYRYEDGDIHLKFINIEGETDFRILETDYYNRKVRGTLKLESVHTIRYVPQNYDHGPVLEQHFDQVRAYRQDLSGLYFIIGVSWLLLSIRPDFLYLGYVDDNDLLFKRRVLSEKGEQP